MPAISLGFWHNFGAGCNFGRARQIVLTAFEQGITHFDLADNYGPPAGSAEETGDWAYPEDYTGPDGTVYDSQDYFRPAHLPPETEAELQELARRAFRVVNARGYARVDFMYDRNGARTPYLLEINAVPGLKPTSLFPPAAEMAGLPYDEMIGTILEDCLERREPGCSET